MIQSIGSIGIIDAKLVQASEQDLHQASAEHTQVMGFTDSDCGCYTMDVGQC